jgi:hypothetical protein
MSDQVPVAERVATAVRSVPDVVDLHAGALGETVTLLPGGRVPGVKVRDDGVEVHLAVAHGSDLRATADAVRTAVRGVLDRPVTVVVEDVVTPEPEPAPVPVPALPTDTTATPRNGV